MPPNEDVSINKKSCPYCNTNDIVKNGMKGEKQRFKCLNCNKSFIETNMSHVYPQSFKYLSLFLISENFTREEIESVLGISESTLNRWAKSVDHNRGTMHAYDFDRQTNIQAGASRGASQKRIFAKFGRFSIIINGH